MTERRLLIMRHAKSSWDGALEDHQRPLNERGRGDAPRIGRHLVTLGWFPDLVLCSDARRTQETWQRLAEGAGRAASIRHDRTLYLAGLGAFQDALAAVGDTVRTVMILGHNPGCERAVSWLRDEDVRFTTANVALFEGGPASWGTALEDPACWSARALVRPADLH